MLPYGVRTFLQQAKAAHQRSSAIGDNLSQLRRQKSTERGRALQLITIGFFTFWLRGLVVSSPQNRLTMRRNLLRLAYLLIWALLLTAFAVRNAPKLWSALRHDRIPTPSPNASMDRFLEALLLVPQPSERLNQMFAQLPADCRVMFVSPRNDDRRDFVYFAICYLTWPRKIDRVELGPNEKFAGVASERTALVFCGVPANAGPTNRRLIGPNLTLVDPVSSK